MLVFNIYNTMLFKKLMVSSICGVTQPATTYTVDCNIMSKVVLKTIHQHLQRVVW